MSRVALYGAGGSAYHHAAIFARAGSDVSFVFPFDIEKGCLDGFDAFVMPGGGYLAMKGELDPLGASGCRKIREYVERGGMYIGSCAGSYIGATAPASFRASCPDQQELALLDAEIWNQADPENFGLQSPGVGTLLTENVSPGHPVMAGMPPTFAITHYNGPFFTGGEALGRVRGGGESFTAAEEFLGESASSLLVDRAAEAGVANIVAGARHRGRVVLFGSHPEFGTSVSLDDRSEAEQMLRNALEWQLDEEGASERPWTEVRSDRSIESRVVEGDLDRLPRLADGLAARCEELRAAGHGSEWLLPGVSMALFGRSAAEVWNASLRRIPELVAEVMASAPYAPPSRLSFRPPHDWLLDGGYRGIVPLLEQAAQQLALAADHLQKPPSRSADGPYADLLGSPYHLVAGSYLAAIGTITSAALLCRATPPTEAAVQNRDDAK